MKERGRGSVQAAVETNPGISECRGAVENGLASPSVEGTPQGGLLSPLLANLVLDESDCELERRIHRCLCYAVEVALCCRCRAVRSAEKSTVGGPDTNPPQSLYRSAAPISCSRSTELDGRKYRERALA